MRRKFSYFDFQCFIGRDTNDYIGVETLLVSDISGVILI